MRLRTIAALSVALVACAASTARAADSTWLAGDINGDGRADLTQVYAGGIDTRVPDADSLFTGPLRSAWKPTAAFETAVDTAFWVTADVTGDARDDLVQIRSSGIATLASAGDGTYATLREGWTPRPSYGLASPENPWFGADVNGDGKDDLVHLWAGGINTLLSNANGTYALIAEGFLPQGYTMATTTTRWLTADFNGDGRADLVHVTDKGIDSLLSLGNGQWSVIRQAWSPRAGYVMNPTGTPWFTGDANADGRTDLLHLWDGGINTLLSTGDGTFPLLLEGWRPSSAYNMAIGSTRWLAGDVNHDGRADLVHVAAGGIDTLLAKGDGTSLQAFPSPLPPPVVTPPSTTTTNTLPATVQKVASPIPFEWSVKKRFTRIVSLSVKEIPAGGTVELRCSGKGCPFKRKAMKVTRAKANLATALKRAKLKPGAVVEVRVLAPGMIGKVVRFTIRKDALPRKQQLCLAVGGVKPTRC